MTTEKEDMTSYKAFKLLINQYPTYSMSPIVPVEKQGRNNKMFRISKNELIRLPISKKYSDSIILEFKWLPFLAKNFSLEVPLPLFLGKPSSIFYYNWAIYKWIEGKSANNVYLDDSLLSTMAHSLSIFLKQLHTIDTKGGPPPGKHNFYRGGNLSTYDKDVQTYLKILNKIIDVKNIKLVWKKALSSNYNKNSVWIHGDISDGNIILHNNSLQAIIDWSCMAIGDPSCDLAIAWTIFKNESREIFKKNLSNIDKQTWERARGWALWKALYELSLIIGKKSPLAMIQRRIIDDIVNEHNEYL